MLDLLHRGVEEYRSLGPLQKLRFPVLAAKYMKKVRDLESDCDREVELLLRKLRSDLKQQGLSLELEQLVRKEYARVKAVRRKEFLFYARRAVGLSF
ncbi:MAG: hypothetical protein H0Z39_02935 [Peptococcaceae bacterium]|nr:hypothetical protein [Peptococcaceae bacterium]